ncbi:uncharacterized protein [Parasteatoda tepidariorum]|uniref:uncharacterized protein isoform X1 n=2 Tax=Parasteatoda tepidariorum TaxID=114398 RepID=UPI001C71F801|nr:uncharacterized protein LOC107441832 isoform X1 [Parasteatoda tepidariorum]
MASDFYKKTKDLFEEFQKRELQYLNAEIAAKSHFQYLNEPAQKYLETLNKREKENEEDYFGLMRQMEQLDQHTESITANLRKLESLRLSMSSKTPMWPYSSNTYDRSFNDYTLSNTLKTDYTPNEIFLNTKQSVSSKQRVVEHAFTQTDLMFCENCQFPLTVSSNLRLDESLSPNESLNRVVQSFQSLPIEGVERDVVSDMTIPLNDFMHKNERNLNSNKEINKEKPSVVIHSLPKIPEEPPVQKEILHDKYQTISTDISLPVPLNARSLENKINTADANIPTVIEHKENVVYEKINQQLITDIPVATDYKENVDQGINKHLKTGTPTTTDSKEIVPDVMLNETVNILSSDAKETDKNLHSSVVWEDFALSEKNKDSDLVTSIVVSDLSALSVPLNVSQIESEGEITTLKNNLIKSDVLKQDILSDKGSESPIIAGAPSPSPYSDTASAPSDSDSFDEKERLKESAAYQALLGNVSATKKIQKTIAYSESESEDEVEKALANAARKSSSVPTTITVQEEKPDDSHKNDASEPKAKSEPRKSISLGKSQQLSKSTRKVLGLDTSSGSEGEIRIPEKTSQKTVEDSDDEFFYD